MKVVLVTGCSSEVGHALCHALKSQCDEKGRHVYRIFAADRKAEDLADLEHAGFETLCMDVTVCRSVAAAVEYVVEVAGRIDVAICDAGVMTSGPIIEQQVDSALRVLDINVLGFMRVAQAVMPTMMKQKQGLIVATGSLSAYLTVPFGGIYSGTKACLHSVTEALRMEIAPWSINVMLVELGIMGSTLAANSVHQVPPVEDFHPVYKQALSGTDTDQMIYFHNAKPDRKIHHAIGKIVHAIQKATPPRKLRVGGKSNKLRFMGFTQVWLSPGYISRKLSKACGLTRLLQRLRQQSTST